MGSESNTPLFRSHLASTKLIKREEIQFSDKAGVKITERRSRKLQLFLYGYLHAFWLLSFNVSIKVVHKNSHWVLMSLRKMLIIIITHSFLSDKSKIQAKLTQYSNKWWQISVSKQVHIQYTPQWWLSHSVLLWFTPWCCNPAVKISSTSSSFSVCTGTLPQATADVC